MEQLSRKIRFTLVGFVLLGFYLATIFTNQMWLTNFSIVVIGLALIHSRNFIAEAAVTDEDRIARDVPVAILFQRKMYRVNALIMGVGFILFGIVGILSDLGIITLPIVL